MIKLRLLLLKLSRPSPLELYFPLGVRLHTNLSRLSIHIFYSTFDHGLV